MNNKQRGTAFERRMCEKLAEKGFWVHFISPDMRGAQPFDLIFAKDGQTFVADCKTSDDYMFRVNRLEDNQVLAFNKWLRCGNSTPRVFVLYEGNVYDINYLLLDEKKKISLKTEVPICTLE